MNDFVRPQSMEVPEGGLASFLTATVGDWADTEDEVPRSGIGGVKAVADHLAEYGRYEDTYMVHAAQGETVVPMAVFDENPRLKASLFAQMRAMGIDPEQYVVGSDFNSINPVTGQPEFFLKKLFKGLKKAVKKVVKVIKKVAPIALSIGLSFTPLGPILGSALGSGIGTLVQGGSLKDALKMGAIGGLTAGLFKGIGGAFRGMKPGGEGLIKGFGSGVRSGLPGGATAAPVYEPKGVAGPASIPTEAVATGVGAVDPITRAPIGFNPDAVSISGAPLDLVPPDQGFTAPSILDSAKLDNLQLQGPTGLVPQPVPVSTGTDSSLALGDAYQTATPQAPTVSSSLPTDSINIDANALARSGTTDALTGLPTTPPRFTSNIPMTPQEYLAQKAKTFVGPPSSSATPVQASDTTVELLKKTVPDIKGDELASGPFQDFFRAPVESTKQLFFPKSTSPLDLVAEELGRPGATVEELLADKALNLNLTKLDAKLTSAKNLIANSDMNPNFLRKYGPLAAAGTGILALTTDGEEEMGDSIDPFGQDFKTGSDLYRENPGKYSLFPQLYNNYNYAGGGNVHEFPRRDGAIAGRGTGTSDDIPAMLSDGEFVMTARAVRGAGNGDRNRGVKKMYEVMRTYEGVA